MCTPSEFASRMLAFNPIEAAREVMRDTAEEVIDLNRRQLYEEGIDKKGKALETYSGAAGGSKMARDYYKQKQAKNARTSSNPSYDMKDTGATFESLTLDFQGEDYAITPHTDYALEVIGPDGFGLTVNSEREYWYDTLKSGLVTAMAEATGATTI